MELSAKTLARIKNHYRLSPRETQVVELILLGVDSNAEIADRLGVSLGVAKRYVHDVCVKIGKSSKLELAILLIDGLMKDNLPNLH